MKNKTRKILDFLTQDVHLKHNYYLIGGIFLILALVGYTSYSLFSYEHSESIYVSFKDTEKPVCVIGEPAVSLMEKSSTTTLEMNCTDNYTVADKDLTTSNFTKTGDITVTSVAKEKVGKAMKYIITVTSGTTGGIASIKLNANTVTDTAGNSNLVSNTSNVFIKVSCDAMEEETTTANTPVLASNMIPVCYNSTLDLWVKADSTNTSADYPWYSYTDKKWANAVTVTEKNRNTYLNETAGMPISMIDINTMLVWIPRFSATSNGSYNGGTKVKPGAFDITFVDTNTTAHDAFTFGDEVSGFWIGKFENSSNVSCTIASHSAVGEGCNLTSIRPKILPNATSWLGAMVSTYFYDILNMTESGNQYGFDKTIDTGIDTHMLKNNEWGAVAYLTQSIYGRCSSSTSCTEVGINNNLGFVTGYGAPAGSDSSVANGAYNTAKGINASTTGNQYGVYDMSGGANEYVMGVYWDGEDIYMGYTDSLLPPYKYVSGFNGLVCALSTCFPSGSKVTYTYGVEFPSDSKYYNLYTTSNDYTSAGLQHGMTETTGWYYDYSYLVNSNNPWVTRGERSINSSAAGVFSFSYSYGNANTNHSSRSSIIIN